MRYHIFGYALLFIVEKLQMCHEICLMAITVLLRSNAQIMHARVTSKQRYNQHKETIQFRASHETSVRCIGLRLRPRTAFILPAWSSEFTLCEINSLVFNSSKIHQYNCSEDHAKANTVNTLTLRYIRKDVKNFNTNFLKRVTSVM